MGELMGAFQPFGYRGEENTCLWCGRPLRKETVLATDADKGNPTYKEKSTYGSATIAAERPGYAQNGFFDTQSCGFRYAVEIARLGDRLEETG